MTRAALVLPLFLVACGGSPAAPSIPVPTLPTVPTTMAASPRDGITGASVSASVARSGSTVTATATGYLTRSQADAPVLWLWPQSTAYVQAIVYNFGGAGLYRWPDGSVVRLAFAAGLTRHQGVLAEAAAEMARTTRLSVVVLEPGDATANVVIGVDSGAVASGSGAFTRATSTAGRIASARITFRREQDIEGNGWFNLLLHELGHALGLDHSASRSDTMSADSGRRNDRSFGPEESRALTMMYAWRKAGNQYPDTEPAGLAASNERRTITIACGQ